MKGGRGANSSFISVSMLFVIALSLLISRSVFEVVWDMIRSTVSVSVRERWMFRMGKIHQTFSF